MLTSSVIDFKKGAGPQVRTYLEAFEAIEIYTVDEEKQQAVIVMETTGDKDVNALSNQIKEHPAVIEVSHHSFYFEEEDEKNIPPVENLFKKRG